MGGTDRGAVGPLVQYVEAAEPSLATIALSIVKAGPIEGASLERCGGKRLPLQTPGHLTASQRIGRR